MVGRLVKVMQHLNITPGFYGCCGNGVVKQLFIHHAATTEREHDPAGTDQFQRKCIKSFITDHSIVLAVAAFRVGEIVGMAAASADSPVAWQIGVDVLPQVRRRA